MLAFSTGSDGSFRPRISLEQELGGKGKPVSSEQATCQPLASPLGRGKNLGGGTQGEGRCSSTHTVPTAYREAGKPLGRDAPAAMGL